MLLLEVDEHQHRGRACECEQTRMVNLGQMFGGTPVYFVRWNPDAYRPGERGAEGEAVCMAVRHRHVVVGDLIDDILCGRLFAGTQPIPGALVAALYLFFDGFRDLHREPWRRIS